MDMVMFTGSVSREELRHERAAQYERLTHTAALDRLVVEPPAPVRDAAVDSVGWPATSV